MNISAPQQMNTIPNGGTSSPATGKRRGCEGRSRRTNHKAGA